MPSALTHLRVAIAAAQGLDCVADAFALGNLAPDAGVRQMDKSYAPPKTVTHLKVRGAGDFVLGDWLFYQRYLLKQDDLLPAERSFLLGYFCHLLTDNLWAYQFGKRFAKPVYVQIDMEYLKSLRQIPMLVGKTPNIPKEIANFLSPTLIADSIDETTRQWQHMRAQNETPQCSSEDVQRVSDFVGGAADIFNQAIDKLRRGETPPADSVSVLACFPALPRGLF